MSSKRLGPVLVLTPSGPELDQEEEEVIKDLALKNFIFFKRHFVEKEQVKGLIEGLKRCVTKREPQWHLFCVDQEGGRVQRIGPPLCDPLPQPLEAAKDERDFYGFATSVARSVKGAGLNVNLAPSLDLAGENAPEFLRGRTLGSDPEKVSRLGRVFVEVHMKEGVIPCPKHIPGLSEELEDPHETLPSIPTLSKASMTPFKEVSSLVPMMMSTHVLVSEFDERPFTFSQKCVSFVRRFLEFEGILSTDDLAMGALKEFSLEERMVYSLASGHDLILACLKVRDAVELVEEVEKEVTSSKVLRERLNESYFRIYKTLSRLKF